jgi:hypothetical protein
MSFTEFLDGLRRIARFDTSAPIAHPLADAVQRIVDNPAMSQSRLLARVLRALTNQCGEFRRAEMSGFDAATLKIVIALMDAARAGTNTREEWLKALRASEAAVSS